MPNEKIEFYARIVLDDIGIRPNLKGYRVWIVAAQRVIELKKINYLMFKDIYPEVAKRTNDTVSRIERCTRTAISGGTEKKIKKYFKVNYDITNSVFLALLVQKIKELNTAGNDIV